MGDVAIASAAIEDVSLSHPNAELHLSTLPPWDQLFVSDPRLSKVISIDVRSQSQFSAIYRWLRVVASEDYDLVIDLQTTDRSRLLLSCLWLMGAQIPRRAGNKAVIPYNLAPKNPPVVRHAMAQLALTLDAAGITARTSRPVLHVSEDRRMATIKLLEDLQLDGDYAVFLPGSQAAGFLKRWGADRFIGLANLVIKQGLKYVVVLGGPEEIEECERIEQGCGKWLLNLCGRTQLLDIVPICDGARFIVGNDTGTAHVASAAARPMIIICGPTDPLRVLPGGDNVRAIQAPLPCINCYRKECSHHSCMAWITPQDVMAKLHSLDVI